MPELVNTVTYAGLGLLASEAMGFTDFTPVGSGGGGGGVGGGTLPPGLGIPPELFSGLFGDGGLEGILTSQGSQWQGALDTVTQDFQEFAEETGDTVTPDGPLDLLDLPEGFDASIPSIPDYDPQDIGETTREGSESFIGGLTPNVGVTSATEDITQGTFDVGVSMYEGLARGTAASTPIDEWGAGTRDVVDDVTQSETWQAGSEVADTFNPMDMAGDINQDIGATSDYVGDVTSDPVGNTEQWVNNQWVVPSGPGPLPNETITVGDVAGGLDTGDPNQGETATESAEGLRSMREYYQNQNSGGSNNGPAVENASYEQYESNNTGPSALGYGSSETAGTDTNPQSVADNSSQNRTKKKRRERLDSGTSSRGTNPI